MMERRTTRRDDEGWKRFSEDKRSTDRPSGDTVSCHLFSCECLGDDGKLYPMVFPGLLNPARESRPVLSGLTALHTVVRIVAWRELPAPAEGIGRAPALPPNPDWRSSGEELPESDGEFLVKSAVFMSGVETTLEFRVGKAVFRHSPEGSGFLRGGEPVQRVVAWAPLPEQQGGNVR